MPQSREVRVYTPDDVPLADDWCAPADLGPLRASRLYREETVDNRTPIELLVGRDLPADPTRELWLAVVPGCSEARGHHKAWLPPDGHPEQLVEPEFRARLEHAYHLLEEGVVRYLFVSGGSVDAEAPWYNEGLLGREQLLLDFEKGWRAAPAAGGDPLAHRIIVDPYALHSACNVRNGDRLTVMCGLDRNLVVTTAGLFGQGWWIAEGPPPSFHFASFDAQCERRLGYTLGLFRAMPTGERGGNIFGSRAHHHPVRKKRKHETMVILHWELATAALCQDARW